MWKFFLHVDEMSGRKRRNSSPEGPSKSRRPVSPPIKQTSSESSSKKRISSSDTLPCASSSKKFASPLKKNQALSLGRKQAKPPKNKASSSQTGALASKSRKERRMYKSLIEKKRNIRPSPNCIWNYWNSKLRIKVNFGESDQGKRQH